MKKGKVLYLNFEIDPLSCIQRFKDIYDTNNLSYQSADQIVLWNLRGESRSLDLLVDEIVTVVKEHQVEAVILDPIYKILTGDENSASEMANFCNQMDKICAQAGCAIIYCHHHSKGQQSNKRTADRASGSGVFARDPDALLDIIALETPAGADGIGFRLEGTLREFPSFGTVNFWFRYPIHELDTEGILTKASEKGSSQSNLDKSSKKTTPQIRENKFEQALARCEKHPPVTCKDLATEMHVSDRSVYRYLEEFPDRYWVKNGIVGRK